MEKEEIRKIANDEITDRANSWGIYDSDVKHIEATRANFVKLNAISPEAVAWANDQSAKAKARSGWLGRASSSVLIGMLSNSGWFILGAIGVGAIKFLFPILQELLKK